jgi:hypothetical protein
MLKNKIAVLAVDPGKMTGVAFFSWTGNPEEDPVLVYSGEVDEDQYAESIEEFLLKIPEYSELKIVCERFTINLQTAKKSQAPFSLEQIGVLKYLAKKSGVSEIIFQSPADAKSMFDNSKLKKLEFWHRGGEGHALDAIRHGLLLFVKLKWIPKALFSK